VTDPDTLQAVRAGLFQPERGLYVVPIRHHSPACAWYLRKLLAEVKPKHVLIEAPADFAPQIPLLLDEATAPPVALVALVDPKGDRPRVAGYYPFCAHSPEFVALRDGQALGANLRFIDAPAADKALGRDPEQTEPLVFTDEHHFDSNDYTRALTQATGCRDGFELWDHLFETQIGADDWQRFFTDVGVYCTGMRMATPPEVIDQTGDTTRETHMAHAVKTALAQGGPVVVVVGGFHAPALIGDLSKKTKPKADSAPTDCYLIRYGFRALDTLNGYAAGLPQPGYYQHLWDHPPASEEGWRAITIDLLSEFSDKMRADGHVISLPAQVEAIRIAEGLSRLRGRPGALRHDLIDGVQGALVKGETQGRDAIVTALQSFLCGDALGQIPAAAGAPPLVEDVHRRARKHRFDVTDTQTRSRKLDIRRKDAHLAASRFCHALALIGSPFATREIGPDFITGNRTDLLFEEWLYTWSPVVEGHLIENAVLGDDLLTACLGHLIRARQMMISKGNARDLPEMVTLLSRGILAGLGTELVAFLTNLSQDVQSLGTFSTTTHALRRLMFLANATGPMRAPDELDLSVTVRAAYGRLIFLCDELPNTSDDQVAERLEAIRTTTEILRDAKTSGLDPDALSEALARVTDRVENPVILGALLAVAVQSGLRRASDLPSAVAGRLTGVSLDLADRIGVLRGILHTAPLLLWHADGLLAIVDDFLCALDEADFLDLLPHLRLAFTALNPRDTDRLAAELARIHDVQTGSLLKTPAASEADLSRALDIERGLLASLATDKLTDWIAGVGK
jgi:hypothetical protein